MLSKANRLKELLSKDVAKRTDEDKVYLNDWWLE